MFRSIRWRLVASYVLLTVLAVSAVGVLALEIMRRYVQQQEVNDLRANAQAIAQQALPLFWPSAHDYDLNHLAHTASFLSNARVRILDPNGETLADSGAPSESNDLVWILPSLGQNPFPSDKVEWPNLMVAPHDSPVLLPEFDFSRMENLPPGVTITFVRRIQTPWGSRFQFESSLPEEQSALAAAQPRSKTRVKEPIRDAEATLGYVELSAAPNYGQQALTATRRALLLAGGGAALLAALVGLVISQRLAAPIRTLTATTGRMAAGDLSSRVQVISQDEIGELATQFNHMAARLEASFQQVASERDALRRFIADASHELRTPITALKNFNSLLLGPAGEDSQAQTEFLNESQLQIQRLEWITHNLLNLSRIDAGLIDLDPADHDVGELIEAAASAFRSIASEKKITLTVKKPASPLQLSCDRPWTEVALSNLIDNAIKFTLAGGEVEIGAEEEGNVTRIWVQDNGVGIHPMDMPHIFERFYRGRNRAAPGSGLGLSMVKSVIEAQGGQVFGESEPGEGSRFVLEWGRPDKTLKRVQ